MPEQRSIAKGLAFGALREHESGFADHGALLWGLMSVELWQRQFVDARGSGAGVAPTTSTKQDVMHG